jgi:hypothetical protein
MNVNERTNTFEGTIQGAQRLTNTGDGNPRFRVFMNSGGPLLTAADAQVNFLITNYIGQAVRITLNESGHIIRVAPVVDLV